MTEINPKHIDKFKNFLISREELEGDLKDELLDLKRLDKIKMFLTNKIGLESSYIHDLMADFQEKIS